MRVAVTLFGAAPSPGLAQTADHQKGADVAAQDGEQAGRSHAPTIGATIQRWFDLQVASVMARYRYVETDRHVVTSRQLQDSIGLKGRFRLDAHGYYTVNLGVGTGASFTSGWNNTGLGAKADRVTNLYLKQLFAVAAPVNGFQFSVGGLAFVRGESTELTTYDNDGYLVGERITVTHPVFYFNEITCTNAYLGDTTTPNVFARYHRLGEPNYRQLLVSKQVVPWLMLSGDYTRLSGVGTVRAAMTAKTRRLRVVDLIQYEQYRRGGVDAAVGFGVFGEKAIRRRATARLGYADIDGNYGGLNADRFNSGRRWYAQGDFVVTRDLSGTVFVSRAFRNAFPVASATRVDVVVTYNVMGPLRRAGLAR